MESKLPKPTQLRRPTPLSRNILPMDRIRTGVNRPAVEPNARDLSNARAVDRVKSHEEFLELNLERARSPDIAPRNVLTARNKMRRSKSACDLRELRPTKRPEPTLSPIPAKTKRMGTTVGANTEAASRTTFRMNGTVPSLPAQKRVTAKTTTATGRGFSSTAAGKKPLASASTSTAVSSTGAGKPINKRIPPYDFKARYNDLLEKHKVLKAKFEEKCELMGNLENLPEQLEETKAELSQTQVELRQFEAENEVLLKKTESQASKIDSLSKCLGKTQDDLKKLKQDHQELKRVHDGLSAEVVELRERCQNLADNNEELKRELEECKEQLFLSNIERKELHNTVMDLRGNIRVFCRVRPPLEEEGNKVLCGWNYVDESTVEIQNNELLKGNKASGSHLFSFDHVFHPRSGQEDIFEMVAPLIQSALDGYNICIFAYGQTGSGKTYTMDGITSDPGVIPRTVDLLFNSIKNYRRLGWEYEIKASFLEIYNEVLYDLLSNEQKDMEIRMVGKGNKNDIYVTNITEEYVDTAARLRHLMDVAKMNRATASTVGNERSSRSHAVTKIELIGRHEGKNEICIGTINLVDLAGSESPKTSTRMNETKNINRSLSELTNVILALLQRNDHIPYRNSKLTHLLMPSLGGNSKTLMFINVAPFLDCFGESVKSLRFAANVNSCKMSRVRKNKFLNTSQSA